MRDSLTLKFSTPKDWWNDRDRAVRDYFQTLAVQQPDFLDFQTADTHYATHAYHGYPATMIPQLPMTFLETIQHFQDVHRIYDPFMGSGTTLVEASLHGIDSVGVDLNPLAQLITDVKTKRLSPRALFAQRDRLLKGIRQDQNAYRQGELTVHPPRFPRISYWFQPEVQVDLQLVKRNIQKISNDSIRKFCAVAFSKTARDVSNTRNGEFKMYRIAPADLARWHPNVLGTFMKNLNDNIVRDQDSPSMSGHSKALLGTASHNPQVATDSCDLLITSPPYGDSQTTVAYGQYCRTSLQWLDLDSLRAVQVPHLDKQLLGGHLQIHDLDRTGSPTLDALLSKIQDKDEKRARQVAQFYQDLMETLKETKRIMKPGSYQFWVTSNRTVKGVRLMTDKIITELYARLGVDELVEFPRRISHKRMPTRNSPLNQKGISARTMAQENIVIYKTPER